MRKLLLRTGAAAAFVLALAAPLASSAPNALAAPNAPTVTVSGVAADIPTGGHLPRVAPSAHAAAERLEYGGGPVMHSNRTHLIFWQPSGSGLSFDPGYESLIETFMSQVAADSHRPSNVYGLTGQYRDTRGAAVYDSQYAGALVDTDPLPPNGCTEPPLTGPGWTVCLSSKQLDDEVRQFIAAHNLPTAAQDLYFLLTPNGFGSCESTGPTGCALGGSAANGYCGYHTSVVGEITKYAVIPYNAINGHCQSDNPRPNASTADPTISTISHEHNESITDPFGTAWADSMSNENGDICISTFGPPLGGSGNSVFNQDIHGGHYYLQEEFSNDDGGCAAHDESDRVSASAPGRVRAHHRAKFSAQAADADGGIAAYDWFFGDGRSAHHRTVHHKYKRRGTYTVTLRVTDTAGNWTLVVRKIKVR